MKVWAIEVRWSDKSKGRTWQTMPQLFDNATDALRMRNVAAMFSRGIDLRVREYARVPGKKAA